VRWQGRREIWKVFQKLSQINVTDMILSTRKGREIVVMEKPHVYKRGVHCGAQAIRSSLGQRFLKCPKRMMGVQDQCNPNRGDSMNAIPASPRVRKCSIKEVRDLYERTFEGWEWSILSFTNRRVPVQNY
jgi:hypothetical protein